MNKLAVVLCLFAYTGLIPIVRGFYPSSDNIYAEEEKGKGSVDYTQATGNTSLFRGLVNADNINIRFDATVNSETICTANKGDYLEVVRELYDWYKIRLPKTAPAFVKKNLVRLLDDQDVYPNAEPKHIKEQSGPRSKVAGDRVNIRLHPNESSPILGVAGKDEAINILDDKGEWYRIEPVNNSFGWVHKKFIDHITDVPKTEDTKAIETAEGEQKKVNDSVLLRDSVSVEGIIKPYRKFIIAATMYKLISDDDKVFLLQGNRKDIYPYNYRRVRVLGKLTSKEGQRYPFVEIIKIEALD